MPGRTLAAFSKKMQTASFSWFLNIFLALIIFLNAQAGRLLGIQELPLSISAVWPPTGFSLAAVLLFGYKTWPGILLGNLCYNIYHLAIEAQDALIPSLAALAISLGSLCQALLGGYIMRRFCSVGYFNSVRDIFIFLIPAGVVSCLIASSVGVTTLYLTGVLSSEEVSKTWLTFWIGDTLGVYIFAPLIVVWSLRVSRVPFMRYRIEAIFMILTFAIISVLCFILNYALAHLYIPLCIWVAYRYSMHGASLANLFINLVAIVATELGRGQFAVEFRGDPLLSLVSRLEIIVVISLFVAAIVNERAAAWRLMHNHDVDVYEAVQMHTEGFKETDIEQFVHDKLATLGILTTGIARQVQLILKKVGHFAQTSKEGLAKLQNATKEQKPKLEIELVRMHENAMENFGNAIQSIAKAGTLGYRIAKMIEEQVSRQVTAKVTVKSVDMNKLLSDALTQSTQELSRRYPEFTFTVIEELDRNIKAIFALPDDLTRAFTLLLNNAIFAMKEKKNRLGSSFQAVLEVRTANLANGIEIIIRDNGIGITDERKKTFFQSFISEEPTDEVTSLGLALAHDLLVHLHKGKVRVDSKEGEYLQITIFLPKP